MSKIRYHLESKYNEDSWEHEEAYDTLKAAQEDKKWNEKYRTVFKYRIRAYASVPVDDDGEPTYEYALKYREAEEPWELDSIPGDSLEDAKALKRDREAYSYPEEKWRVVRRPALKWKKVK